MGVHPVGFSLVEQVVSRVRDRGPLADVCFQLTTGRRRDSSSGVQPLDEHGRRQPVATSWPVLGANHIEQEPGNRTRRDEGGVGGGGNRHCPDGARVPGVLPSRANHPRGVTTWISVFLKRVGAEEVGDDLLSLSANKVACGVKRIQAKPRFGTHRFGRGRVWARHADVVLGADGVTLEERLAPRWHLNVGGYQWRFNTVRVRRLRQRDRKSHGESSGACDQQNTRRGLMLRSVVVLHTILLVPVYKACGVDACRAFSDHPHRPIGYEPAWGRDSICQNRLGCKYHQLNQIVNVLLLVGTEVAQALN